MDSDYRNHNYIGLSIKKMILENFKINSDMISIDYSDRYLDLHNCFEFEELIRLENNSIELKFIKIIGEWVKVEELPGFRLMFKNVSNVYYKDADSDYPIEYLESDNNTPDLFGYSYTGNDIMDGPSDYIKSDNRLEAFILTFVTGRSIKIEASSVEFIDNK